MGWIVCFKQKNRIKKWKLKVAWTSPTATKIKRSHCYWDVGHSRICSICLIESFYEWHTLMHLILKETQCFRLEGGRSKVELKRLKGMIYSPPAARASNLWDDTLRGISKDRRAAVPCPAQVSVPHRIPLPEMGVPHGIPFPEVLAVSSQLLFPVSTLGVPALHSHALPCGIPLAFTAPLDPEAPARLGRCRSKALMLFSTAAIHRDGVGQWCWLLSVLMCSCTGMVSLDLDVFPLVAGQLPKRK